jgi:hypothetical protein
LRQKVTAKINASPYASLWSQEQKNQFIEQQVNEHVTSRIPEIELETGLQRLEATFAIAINPLNETSDRPPGLLIFKLGKAHADLGPQLHENGLSQWENEIGQINVGERGNTVAATGSASVGIAYSLNKNLNIYMNFIGYHDRDPWISAQQYISHSLAVSREVFDKNQDPSDLNSGALNIKADSNYGTIIGHFWGTIVKRVNSNDGYGGTQELIALGNRVDICKYIDSSVQLNCALSAEYQKSLKSTGFKFEDDPEDDFYIGLMGRAAINDL